MIDKDTAIELAAKHLSRQVMEAARKGAVSVSDRWPCGIYNQRDEPVWAVSVPSETPGVGATRVLVISRITGDVIFDGHVDE